MEEPSSRSQPLLSPRPGHVATRVAPRFWKPLSPTPCIVGVSGVRYPHATEFRGSQGLESPRPRSVWSRTLTTGTWGSRGSWGILPPKE